MRIIKYIILHCTATPQNTTVESILRYWRNDLGWKNPGYHYIIKSDGEVVELLPIEQVSNGVKGFNSTSVNIAYIGGVDGKGKALDNRTAAQVASQIRLIRLLKAKFPTAEIKGHRDFPNVKKDCPSFDVNSWLKTVGLACLMAVLFMGCKSKQTIVQPAKIITTTTSKVITKNTRDTTFIVESDSSYYKAWIECVNNKPVIRNPTATKGNNNLNAPQVKLNELGELIATCATENLELKARINELTTEIANTSNVVEHVPVEIIKELTFNQKLLINLGKIFGAILLLTIGYGAFKLVSKYYVRK